MKRKVKLLALIPAMLLTLTVVLTLLTGAAHAYKLAVDVPLSNGHKVTVQFADNFPDQLLQTHVGYMQTYIPRIAELFYMPDHDFELAYDTEPPPDGCSPGAIAGWRRICLRTDILEGEDVAAIIAHEVTHVFQDEIPPGFSTLLWEGSAVAVAMILTHALGYGQVINGAVDYTAITPENGLGVYLNGRSALQAYILGNGLEKLYAYKPTYLREWTSQASALQNSDSYNAIFGEAILDSKPLSRWLYEQGLGTWGPTDSGIYAETYAALFTGKFFARAEVWQWTTDGRITKVAPQTATCRIYRLNGEYITERQAEIFQGSWPSAYWGAIEDPNITYDTEAVRVDIHIEAAGRTIERHLIAFEYLDQTAPGQSGGTYYNWIGLVDNNALPLLVDGTATINLQTIAGASQTLQASITSGIFKFPVVNEYGVADIDITTPALQYHIENFPFTYRARGLTLNPYVPSLGIHTDKWYLTASETTRLIVETYPPVSGGTLTIQYNNRISEDAWHTLIEDAQLQNGRYEQEWKSNYSGEGYAEYLLKASWQQDPASPVVASNSLLVRQEGGASPPVCEYTIAANPPTISVQQGGSTSTTLTATETSGTCEAISWTVNDLGGATDLTATIDPTTGLTVGLTVTAQPTASIGTYTVMLRASAGTVTRDTAVTVSVQQQGTVTRHPLAVNINPGGTGALSLNPQTPDNYYEQGTVIEATATPTAGYSFDHWELDGQNMGASQPYVFTMDAPHTLAAVFTAPPPEQPTPQPPPRCIIATAAYGSEMAPEVAYMRHVRDNLIASTPTGKTLRDAFNAWYYSWSPPIAQAVSANSALQAIFRILLQPIIAIVHIAAWTYTSIGGGDTAAVAAFTIAAILAVAAYIATPTLALLALKRHKANRAKTKALNFDDRTSEPAFKS